MTDENAPIKAGEQPPAVVKDPTPPTETVTDVLQLTGDDKPADAPPEKTVPAATVADILPTATPATPPTNDKPFEFVPPPEVLICTCEVAKRGRGRHAKTCPKFTPNKSSDEPTPTLPKVPEPSSVVASLTAPPKPEKPVDYKALAAALFDMSIGTLTVAFGPEWKPQTPEERAGVVGAFATYLEANEIKDIPPGVMLTIVASMYALPRLNQPGTKTKLKMGWLWLKDKFTRKKK